MGTSTPLNWLGTLNPSPGLLSFSPFKQPFHCSHQPSGPSSGSFLITQPCWSNTLDISDVGWNVSLDVAWRGWFEVKMLLLFGTFWDIPVMLSDTYHVRECLGKMNIENMKGTCKMKIQNCLQVWQILMISWDMFWSFFVRSSAMVGKPLTLHKKMRCSFPEAPSGADLFRRGRWWHEWHLQHRDLQWQIAPLPDTWRRWKICWTWVMALDLAKLPVRCRQIPM